MFSKKMASMDVLLFSNLNQYLPVILVRALHATEVGRALVPQGGVRLRAKGTTHDTKAAKDMASQVLCAWGVGPPGHTSSGCHGPHLRSRPWAAPTSPAAVPNPPSRDPAAPQVVMCAITALNMWDKLLNCCTSSRFRFTATDDVDDEYTEKVGWGCRVRKVIDDG